MNQNPAKSLTGTSRRIYFALKHLESEEFEEALMHLFRALDSTSKKRYPKYKPGMRIKTFLRDEETLILFMATGSLFDGGIYYNDRDMADVIYRFARTSAVHDEFLDHRVQFNRESGVSIGEVWNFPPQMIHGLILATMCSPENSECRIKIEFHLEFLGKNYKEEDIWGKKDLFNKRIKDKFHR
jgi:hypothetical protein